MLKISDFARLAGVSPKALRIYDEMGILKPSAVDRWTSYRYYSISQLAALNRILALRDLGFSLDQIAALLRDGLPPAVVRELLRAREQELRNHLSDEQARLQRIQARLRSLEQEDHMPEYEIVLKNVAPMRVAALSGTIPNFSGLEAQWDKLYDYLRPHGVPWSIPNLIIWHEPDDPDVVMAVEVAAPLPADAQVPAGDGVTVYTLPGGLMATAVHHGGYDTIGDAYNALYRWLEQNGYTLTAPTRQLHLAYAHDQPPDTYVTELQFPVQKKTDDAESTPD
jgi:DNA-binding transcriptional MerR regulator/effector-binding domain-containing protein